MKSQRADEVIKYTLPVGHRRAGPNLGQARAAVRDLAEGGAIDPYVCAAFPLEQAVDAMRLLENREAVGKCVVTVNGDELEGG